jgi:hypothetical protein
MKTLDKIEANRQKSQMLGREVELLVYQTLSKGEDFGEYFLHLSTGDDFIITIAHKRKPINE